MTFDEIVKALRSEANPKNVEGMARFGINTKNTLGISMVFIRKLGRKIGKNHSLATKLWNSKIHEARILAALIDEPAKVTKEQMDRWSSQFDSWDICDQVCSNLFDKTPFAYAKAKEWTKSNREFQKRAGFVLMAALSVHDKKADDVKFLSFFPLIKKHATDERNFVRKAVNWALRQIGKRNQFLRKHCIALSEEIMAFDSKAARWIAADALRELKKYE